MSSNENIVCDAYYNSYEDTRSTQSRANSIEFHYTKKFANQYINNTSSESEIWQNEQSYFIM